MSQPITVQLENAERALAELDGKNTPTIVRTALINEIAAIKKKLNGVKNRKAHLTDGTVGVGDKVWIIKLRNIGRYGSNNDLVLPKLLEQTVSAVSPDGSRIAVRTNYYNGRADYNELRRYFATRAGAALQAYNKEVSNLHERETELANAQKNLQYAQEDLPIFKAWAISEGAYIEEEAHEEARASLA
jgi:hypothetical protein